MTDTSRRWERLRDIGAELASDYIGSIVGIREAITEAARDFETATAAAPEAEAVHVFVDGLVGALGEFIAANK